MSKLRSLAALALLCATLICVLVPTDSYGQTAKRATRAQIAEVLKKDATLTTGFKSSQNATVQVVRAVPGGVLLRFQGSDGIKGNITVVGPVTVMDKGFWDTVIGIAVALGKAVFSSGDGGGSGGGSGSGSGGGGGGTSGTAGCANISVGGSGNTININGSVCHGPA